jgi:gliding motility-associated-like protein
MLHTVTRYDIPFLRPALLWAALMIASTGQAQLCNGSLGDPVVNITFDSRAGGPTYTPPAGYTFTSSTCPNDGSYTITGSTSGCFGGSWHTVNTDHSGHGQFMLVNASFTPSDFFVATVKDLCPNTNYEFASWIMNVLIPHGIKPNVTFTIEKPDGSVLQTFSTGDIAETSSPQWKQYGFYFTTPPDNAEIVLRMRNNAPGGAGNDLALDDITFRPCGPIIQANIQGHADSLDFCQSHRERYTLAGQASADYVDPVYQWQSSVDTGVTWTDIAGATSGTYTTDPIGPGWFGYRLSITERSSASIISCRIASTVLVVNLHRDPEVNAGADRVLFAGDTLHLHGVVTGENPEYSWAPADGLTDLSNLSAVASPAASVTYTLAARTPWGCAAQDAMDVKVVQDIFVPNAFTPNGDGLNDHWHIPFLDPVFGASVRVYNRYGKQVYHVSGNWVDWDGKVNGTEQATGIYLYVIHFAHGRKDMKGFLSLIR